ncbi:MAG: glycosyltransferase [Bacteroidia bacterium]|nr:glycosyltransferase [Bacteroidia bacterium]
MIEVVLLFILWAHLLVQLIIIAGILAEPKVVTKKTNFPFVSIFVPARNEEDNIEACLKSLLLLDYPSEQVEIIVGNDSSTDRTAEIIQSLSGQYPRIKLYNVVGKAGNARAKANVLAQLIGQCKGEIIFVTDADITVPESWIKNLLPFLLEPHIGIVSGTTLVDGKSFFEKMQGLEWLLANGNLLGLDGVGMKSTAVGNNMAFPKEAYLKTGGYEKMPFSVTEDFQLFKHIRKLGYKTYNLAHIDSLNISKAQPKLIKLLHQRKRWMIGARGLPWYWFPVFLISAFYVPALIVLMFINIKSAILIAALKFIFQTLFLLYLQNKFRRKTNWLYLLVFEPYYYIINTLMIIFYLLPVKMDWKGRKY